MQKPPLYIRADGNAKIGLGHIYRTLALADQLKNDFTITFFSVAPDETMKRLLTEKHYPLKELTKQETDQAQAFLAQLSEKGIVVLDGYHFDPNYQQEIRAKGHKLVMLDDLNSGIQVADAVINHAYSGDAGDYQLSPHTRLYAGLDYLIVREEIVAAEFSAPKSGTDQVLVCIGGTDPGNYSMTIAQELLQKTSKRIYVLTSQLNPQYQELIALAKQHPERMQMHAGLNGQDLIHLIRSCDIAIVQPSNIALESASLGIYLALLQTADNQAYVLQTLTSIGCGSEIKLNGLADTINKISIGQINTQMEQQQLHLRKNSGNRLLSVFNGLLLSFRKAEEKDVEDIYAWNNDAVTRANSYNKDTIVYGDHVKWYSQKIKDPNSCFLVFTYNNQKAGTVRIDIKEKETVIGITIAPSFRGKKLAGEMLDQASDYFFKHYTAASITAYIKVENTASLKSFKRAAFQVTDRGLYFGAESYKLIRTHEKF